MLKPISRGVENFYIWLSEEFICSQPFKSYTYSKSWDTYIVKLIFRCSLSWQGYLHSSLIQSISCLHNPWHCSIKHCTNKLLMHFTASRKSLPKFSFVFKSNKIINWINTIQIEFLEWAFRVKGWASYNSIYVLSFHEGNCK